MRRLLLLFLHPKLLGITTHHSCSNLLGWCLVKSWVSWWWLDWCAVVLRALGIHKYWTPSHLRIHSDRSKSVRNLLNFSLLPALTNPACTKTTSPSRKSFGALLPLLVAISTCFCFLASISCEWSTYMVKLFGRQDLGLRPKNLSAGLPEESWTC